jgi:hypothetical protein
VALREKQNQEAVLEECQRKKESSGEKRSDPLKLIDPPDAVTMRAALQMTGRKGGRDKSLNSHIVSLKLLTMTGNKYHSRH